MTHTPLTKAERDELRRLYAASHYVPLDSALPRLLADLDAAEAERDASRFHLAALASAASSIDPSDHCYVADIEAFRAAIASSQAYSNGDEIDKIAGSELRAVMESVDKWLSGDDLTANPATRAARAREVALKAIDAAEAERDEAVAEHTQRAVDQQNATAHGASWWPEKAIELRARAEKAEAQRDRAESERDDYRKRLAEALVRNDEDDLGCDRARMEEMRDERDALKAQEGEWADQISAALNSTADKLGRTPSMIAGHVRREHEAHTACFDRLRKAVDERDALKARLGNIECLHCGDIDPDVSHWEQCKEHPARATVDALKAKLAARSEKDSHSWHELYKDTKAKLAALVDAAEPFACDQGCDAVHHPVKDRHDQRDNCPVVARLRAAIAAARGGAL